MKASKCEGALCLRVPRGRGVVEREPEFEHRPRRHGEASEARRLDEGFRMLNGEGVYDERNYD